LGLLGPVCKHLFVWVLHCYIGIGFYLIPGIHDYSAEFTGFHCIHYSDETDRAVHIVAYVIPEFFKLWDVVLIISSTGWYSENTFIGAENTQSMSGIIFLRTKNLNSVVDFYVSEVGATVWLDQTACIIVKHGNLLLGFCQSETSDCELMITFFYPHKAEVDRMYQNLKEIARRLWQMKTFQFRTLHAGAVLFGEAVAVKNFYILGSQSCHALTNVLPHAGRTSFAHGHHDPYGAEVRVQLLSRHDQPTEKKTDSPEYGCPLFLDHFNSFRGSPDKPETAVKTAAIAGNEFRADSLSAVKSAQISLMGNRCQGKQIDYRVFRRDAGNFGGPFELGYSGVVIVRCIVKRRR